MVLIVIPARYQSTRLPGKPLVRIAGVSLIERVYRICAQLKDIAVPVVATDDRRIYEHVRGFGGRVMMTKRSHPSGTDRAAEVARKFDASIVVNVQGDEPLLDPRVIRSLIRVMQKNAKIEMGTLSHVLDDKQDYQDPNVVKVVADENCRALYFSRSAIPYFRDGKFDKRVCQRHIGIYAYRKKFLLQYVRWPQSSMEKSEKLEQLRALEHGASIYVLKTSYHAIGVDVPSDVRKVEKLLGKIRR